MLAHLCVLATSPSCPGYNRQLLLAAAGFGVLAYGGNEFGQGRPFLDPALAAGPVPAAVMAILGGFTWSAFHVVLAENKGSFEDWA